jgi:hypothetical protein
MGDFVYTTVTGKIRPLLDKVRSVGIPTKVTTVWLKTVGFTSSNDASLVGVLKFVGFIDGAGVPTSAWNAYRGAKHKAVLGEQIRKRYAELYAVYPDAHSRTNQEISHVFSTSSSAGAQVVAKTVQTFKALVEDAEFTSTGSGETTVLHAETLHSAPAPTTTQSAAVASVHGRPEVHIDIQIHISPESTTQQIDKIFESMARHLYGRRDD